MSSEHESEQTNSIGQLTIKVYRSGLSRYYGRGFTDRTDLRVPAQNLSRQFADGCCQIKIGKPVNYNLENRYIKKLKI